MPDPGPVFAVLDGDGQVAFFIPDAPDADAVAEEGAELFGADHRVVEYVPACVVGTSSLALRHTPIDAIQAVEAAMDMGEEEHGDRWRRRPVLHHVKKGLGHALSAGPRGDGIDDDSGHPHLVLAATRMVLAVAVLLQERTFPQRHADPR